MASVLKHDRRQAVQTYADLRGTTIGTQTLTSGTGFALRLVLKVHGLDIRAITRCFNIGGAPTAIRH